jgi:hypothetical protein
MTKKQLTPRRPHEKVRERLTLFLDPEVSQFFNRHGVDPRKFIERVFADLTSPDDLPDSQEVEAIWIYWHACGYPRGDD